MPCDCCLGVCKQCFDTMLKPRYASAVWFMYAAACQPSDTQLDCHCRPKNPELPKRCRKCREAYEPLTCTLCCEPSVKFFRHRRGVGLPRRAATTLCSPGGRCSLPLSVAPTLPCAWNIHMRRSAAQPLQNAPFLSAARAPAAAYTTPHTATNT